MTHALSCLSWPWGAWSLLSSRERKTQCYFKGYGRRVLQTQRAAKEPIHHVSTQPGLESRSQAPAAGDLRSERDTFHNRTNTLLNNSQGKSHSSMTDYSLANLCTERDAEFKGAWGLTLWWQTTSKVSCLKTLWLRTFMGILSKGPHLSSWWKIPLCFLHSICSDSVKKNR